MQKRFVPIAIVTGILFLVAVGGYLAPAAPEGPPVRVLLENKGGKVILNHARHIDDMGGRCDDCHHTSGDEINPPTCSSCHVGKFDDAFITDHQEKMDKRQCAACHHAGATIDKFNHDEHVDDYASGDCQTCHHGADIESEPQACSNCHTDKAGAGPSLREAAHARCTDCHDDYFKEGAVGCTRCHVRKTEPAAKADYTACSACHVTPADRLVSATMTAYHDQCRGCHEKNGSGPFKEDSCYQCHMK